MNANELADELQELDSKLDFINLFKASIMLREQQRTINGDKRLINLLYGKIALQQAEINVLITEREQNAQNIDQISKNLPNGNEPVAWMLKTGHGTKIVEKKPYCEVDYWIPLYTHPAKTLTDEEIDAIGDEVSNLIDTYAGRREFARAVLRKAQSNCNGFCGEYECKENQINCKRKAQEK